MKLIWMLLVVLVAIGKGRRVLPWAILGYFGGWLAFGMVLLSRQRPIRPVPPWMLNLGYRSQAKQAVASIDTPKDLFN